MHVRVQWPEGLRRSCCCCWRGKPWTPNIHQEWMLTLVPNQGAKRCKLETSLLRTVALLLKNRPCVLPVNTCIGSVGLFTEGGAWAAALLAAGKLSCPSTSRAGAAVGNVGAWRVGLLCVYPASRTNSSPRIQLWTNSLRHVVAM